MYTPYSSNEKICRKTQYSFISYTMQTFRCRQCREKHSIEWAKITSWVHRFCSKKCRLEYSRIQKRKQLEKEKARKSKKREKKANSVSVLKNKLWTIVSLYIRLRDSDDDNYCICCTCWQRRHYKDSMQAGHYIPSGSSSFHRYNEKNIHAQCYWCNVGKWGNLIEYRPFMIQKYWLEYTDWLYETRNEITPLWATELKELIDQYGAKLAEIQSRKAID